MKLFGRIPKDSIQGAGLKRLLTEIRVASTDPFYGGLTPQKLPVQLDVMFGYLNFLGIRVTQLFVKEVSTTSILALQDRLDREPHNIANTIINTKDPYLVGALVIHQLRQYLQLRNPVCDKIPEESWQYASVATERQDIIDSYQACLSQLSPVNHAILKKLCSLLKSLHVEEEITLMNAAKLSRIFVPVLFSSDRAQQRDTINGFEKLILNQSYIFSVVAKDHYVSIESRNGTLYSGPPGSIRRLRVDSSSSVASFQDGSFRRVNSRLTRIPSDGPSTFRGYDAGMSMIAEEPDQGTSTNSIRKAGSFVERSRGEISSFSSPRSRSESRAQQSQGEQKTPRSARTKPNTDLLRDVIVLQYQIFCIEKRMELEESLSYEIQQDYSSKMSTYEEIKKQIDELKAENIEASIHALNHSIELESETLAETIKANEELESIVQKLEDEFLAVSMSTNHPNRKATIEIEQETESINAQTKSKERENMELMASIKLLKEHVDSMRRMNGLAPLSFEEVEIS